MKVNTDWVVQQFREKTDGGTGAVQAWKEVEKEFLEQYTKGDAGQAWKSVSGKAFEKAIQLLFHNLIRKDKDSPPLEIKQWKEAAKIPVVKRILSEHRWVRGEIREPYLAESQVDFVALALQDDNPYRVVAVYSCKTSLRERFQQDLFWADRLRSRGIRFGFITLDQDGDFEEVIQDGEIEKASKSAKMAMALYDRVYLFYEEGQIRHFSHILRPVDHLLIDLKKWLEAD